MGGITQSGTAAGSNVTVNQTGALTISGAISTTAAANGVISLTSSGPLTANAWVSAGGSGNLTLTGGSSTGNFVRRQHQRGHRESGTGAVLLQSTGGGTTGGNNYGVVIQAGGVVETTGATGTVTINGTGGGSPRLVRRRRRGDRRRLTGDLGRRQRLDHRPRRSRGRRVRRGISGFASRPAAM